VFRYARQVRKTKPSNGTLVLGSYMFIILVWILLIFMHLHGVI